MTLKRSPMKRSTPLAVGKGALRRSTEWARSSELKRTPFQRAPARPDDDQGDESDSRGAATKAPKVYVRPKTKGPKMTPIRRSAKGEQCTLRIPGICRNRTDTTVWCHSNRLTDGKGMSLKANDEAGCYGCFDCHSFLDGGWARYPEWSYDVVQQYFEVARARSLVLLRQKGLVAV